MVHPLHPGHLPLDHPVRPAVHHRTNPLPDLSRPVTGPGAGLWAPGTTVSLLCRDGLCCHERRVLALERLDRAVAPALGQGL